MINKFRYPYDYLSNFYQAGVMWKGQVYPTVEHAYQAAKTLDSAWQERIRMAETPARAKQLGRLAPLRPDWEDMKLGVMSFLVGQKFERHRHLARLLLDTGYQHLEEGNWWGDTFWGTCKGVGENHLGLILMQMRDLLRKGV